jgi:fibronectin-binding autotransporter adhesin
MNSAGRTQTLSGSSTYSGATLVSNGTLRLTQAQCLSTSTAVTIDGGVLNLDFTGTNTVRSLQVGSVLRSEGVYGASRIPGAITGTGFLRTLEPAAQGTVIVVF